MVHFSTLLFVSIWVSSTLGAPLPHSWALVARTDEGYLRYGRPLPGLLTPPYTPKPYYAPSSAGGPPPPRRPVPIIAQNTGHIQVQPYNPAPAVNPSQFADSRNHRASSTGSRASSVNGAGPRLGPSGYADYDSTFGPGRASQSPAKYTGPSIITSFEEDQQELAAKRAGNARGVFQIVPPPQNSYSAHPSSRVPSSAGNTGYRQGSISIADSSRSGNSIGIHDVPPTTRLNSHRSSTRSPSTSSASSNWVAPPGDPNHDQEPYHPTYQTWEEEQAYYAGCAAAVMPLNGRRAYDKPELIAAFDRGFHDTRFGPDARGSGRTGRNRASSVSMGHSHGTVSSSRSGSNRSSSTVRGVTPGSVRSHSSFVPSLHSHQGSSIRTPDSSIQGSSRSSTRSKKH